MLCKPAKRLRSLSREVLNVARVTSFAEDVEREARSAAARTEHLPAPLARPAHVRRAGL